MYSSFHVVSCACRSPTQCSCRSWVCPIFSVTDAELMRTAGLDALIFHRAFTFGILFFTPVTALALCACKALLHDWLLCS